jgi:parallel beta-helix repeat protein
VAGPGILLTQNSDQNFLANNNVFVSFGNGIEVDLGSDQNVVQNNTVVTATSPPGYFALFDQNSDCGSNIWTNNVFNNEFVAGQISANPAGCIH